MAIKEIINLAPANSLFALMNESLLKNLDILNKWVIDMQSSNNRSAMFNLNRGN